jgi:hypothetical protein
MSTTPSFYFFPTNNFSKWLKCPCLQPPLSPQSWAMCRRSPSTASALSSPAHTSLWLIIRRRGHALRVHLRASQRSVHLLPASVLLPLIVCPRTCAAARGPSVCPTTARRPPPAHVFELGPLVIWGCVLLLFLLDVHRSPMCAFELSVRLCTPCHCWPSTSYRCSATAHHPPLVCALSRYATMLSYRSSALTKYDRRREVGCFCLFTLIKNKKMT